MEPREYEQSRPVKTPKPANVLVGLIILAVGVVLLLDRLDFVLIPHWVFTWPMLLIVIGLVMGAKKNFHGAGWLILVLIGTFFLLDHHFVFHWDLHRYGLPLGIIILGLFLVFRSVSSSHRRDSQYYTTYKFEKSEQEETVGREKRMSTESDDYIDQVNVFGSSKSKIFSKKFRGGAAINFFGGAEIDLTQADVEGKAVLDVVQVFGGLKLIVPANWIVKTDAAVTILGGFNDKRPSSTSDSGKVLVITGTCIFGGIEIKSY